MRKTPMPPRERPMKGSTSPIRRNRSRSAKNYERAYGSPERVAWVKSLGCVVCGRTPCDNAHIKTGGVGRKADASSIVPLCSGAAGCHAELHRVGIKTFGRRHDIDLCRCAERIENAWQFRNPMTSVASVLRGGGCE